MNPDASQNEANCPETADALNDYLRTGAVRQVRTGGAMPTFSFPPGLRWQTVNLATVMTGLRNCTHRVVRGVRDARAMGPDATLEHYFVVFKVDNRTWVADAYTSELIPNLRAYIDAEPENRRMRTFQIPVGAAYDVTVEDALAGVE